MHHFRKLMDISGAPSLWEAKYQCGVTCIEELCANPLTNGLFYKSKKLLPLRRRSSQNAPDLAQTGVSVPASARLSPVSLPVVSVAGVGSRLLVR